jgi:hypothetical protein
MASSILVPLVQFAAAWSPSARARLLTRVFLPVLTLCATSTPAHSADWRLTAIRSTRYGASLAFVDVSSVKGGNGRVSFWASTYFSRSTRGMNRVSALVTANCGTLTYRFDQIVLFYNQRPLGRWTSRATSTAVPKTNVFDEISSTCGARDLGTHVGTPEAFAAAYFVEQRQPT